MPALPAGALDQLQAIDDPAILLSGDHRILAVNPAYQARFGDTIVPGESRCFRISHGYDRPCDLEGETCPVRACMATGRPSQVTHVHQHGGEQHVCHIELLPVADARGEVVSFIEVMRPERAEHHGLVGHSASFRRVIELLEAVAPTSVPVLLLGETGTGKERVAQAIHDASARREGPLVAVECPGVQESLFESELFGHERGAFTGADRRREGLVDAARGGTLFLDEIGDLSLAMQVKLLRLLEANTYRRVGSTQPLQADFRLVAATHRDLKAMVDAGSFRADLYYRLGVYPIELPALRERREDVLALADALLDGRSTLQPDAIEALRRWSWPGNIRELRNALERALVLAGGGPIGAEHLPTELVNGAAPAETDAGRWPWGDQILPLDDVQARYLRWAQAKASSREELARRLGLSLRQLYRRLAQL
jgi:transcriptional regulator with PAS, ATPase and Fis domain